MAHSSLSTLSPRFPYELFDMILDCLIADSPSFSVLASLSLVCHAFSVRAQPFMWRCVVLYPTPATSRCARLHALLLANPALPPMIHELAARTRQPIYDDPDMPTRIPEDESSDDDDTSSQDSSDEDEPQPNRPYVPHTSSNNALGRLYVVSAPPSDPEPVSLSTDPSFPCVLRMLPHLSSLHLDGLKWREQPLNLNAALRTVLRSPALTHLVYRGATVPLYVLESAPALRCLVLDNTDIIFPPEPLDEVEGYAKGKGSIVDERDSNNELHPDNYSRMRVQLNTLGVGFDSLELVINWVLFDVSALTSLSVRLPFADHSSECFRDHFHGGNVVRRLFIDCLDTIIYYRLPIFPLFPELRTLIIAYPAWLLTPWAPDLADLLANIPCDNLDTLVLILNIEYEDSLYQDVNQFPTDWVPLDAQIMRMRPRRVVVQVHPASGREERVVGREVVARGLPRVRESGVLRVGEIPDFGPAAQLVDSDVSWALVDSPVGSRWVAPL